MLDVNIFAKGGVFGMVTIRHHLCFGPFLFISRGSIWTISRDSDAPLMKSHSFSNLNLFRLDSHWLILLHSNAFAVDTNFQSGGHDWGSDLMIFWAWGRRQHLLTFYRLLKFPEFLVSRWDIVNCSGHLRPKLLILWIVFLFSLRKWRLICIFPLKSNIYSINGRSHSRNNLVQFGGSFHAFRLILVCLFIFSVWVNCILEEDVLIQGIAGSI